MSGFPITAWGLRHPGGHEIGIVAECVRRGQKPSRLPAKACIAAPIEETLLDELVAPCGRACARWGSSRVGLVLGDRGAPRPSSGESGLHHRICTRVGMTGPAYRVMAAQGSSLNAVASAERMLRASLADAVLVGSIGDDEGGLLLIERHGDAFVKLRASAEVMGDPPFAPDRRALLRAMEAAWSAGGSPPRTNIQWQGSMAALDIKDVEAHIERLWGPTPCWVVDLEGPQSGVTEFLVAVDALLCGSTPQSPSRELEHDRVLVASVSCDGHHMALLLEAGP